jgi:hypothetical protein
MAIPVAVGEDNSGCGTRSCIEGSGGASENLLDRCAALVYNNIGGPDGQRTYASSHRFGEKRGGLPGRPSLTGIGGKRRSFF